MALETLKGVTEFGGFNVVVMDDLREKHPERFTETGAMDHVWFETTIRPNSFIYVRNDKNSLAFTLQSGPVREVGINGCQVDTLIHAARHIIIELNLKLHSAHNLTAIAGLNTAIAALDARTAERQASGVEGTSNV